MSNNKEKTLVLLKPDALQRNFLGQIITRFENKGLKIVGLKMIQLEDVVLEDHYSHIKDKPFFADLRKYMQSAPVIGMVLEGLEAVKVVRTMAGPTSGREAPAGTIRGDFSLSLQSNVIHASDSLEAAEKEVWRFFNNDEVFDYKKLDYEIVYASDERE